MDNDREVRAIVERSKLMFLKEAIEDYKRKQSQYDLGTEFAKTRKNRTPLVPAVIIGMLLLFAVGAFGITWYIDDSSRNIQISIEDFQDVALRDLLDVARRNEQDLEQAERRFQELLRQQEREITSVRDNTQRAIDLLEVQELTVNQVAARTNQLRSEEQRATREIRARFGPEIEEIEAEIAVIQTRIAQHDAVQLEIAREQQDVIDNQQRVSELEMERTRNQYEQEIAAMTESYETRISELEQYQRTFETNIRRAHRNEISRLREQHANEIAELILRFNPEFSSGEMARILAATPPGSALREHGTAPYRPLLETSGPGARDLYAGIEREIRDLSVILRNMREVPYENAIPSVLAHLEHRTGELVRRYEDIWLGLTDAVADRDEIISSQEELIARFVHAFTELTKDNRENGYVLDARDPENILVFIDRIRDVPTGTRGYVFRRDDELIGVIEFQLREGVVSASLVQSRPDMEIRPFDRILLQVQ